MRSTRDFLRASADAFGEGLPICRQAGATLRGLAEVGTTISTRTAPVPDCLASALTSAEAHPLARLIDLQQILALPWNAGPSEGAAWVEMVGPQAPWLSARNRIGLYLQAPHVFYPRHWHAAEEIYAILSGTALWQGGAGVYQWRRPGDLVRHASMESHAMQTRDEPLLGIWAWSGDLDFESFSLESNDTAPPAHDDPVTSTIAAGADGGPARGGQVAEPRRTTNDVRSAPPRG